jgi:hypothetical protein
MIRNYALFRRNGHRWERVSTEAYPRATAVRVFQNRLLNGAMSGEPVSLRVVPEATPSKVPASQVLCMGCNRGMHQNCTHGGCQCGCAFFQRGF